MIGPLRRYLSVFTLSSRIPLSISFEPDYSRSDFWLPAIGPLASVAALGGAWLGAALFRSPAFVVLFSILAQYAAFNLFHLDGLMDSADAMMPMASPERRLEILKDSRIGVYAFFAGLAAIATRGTCLAALCGEASGLSLAPSLVAALLAAPPAGRAAAALVPRLCASARPKGLGALMKNFSLARVAAGFVVALLPLAAWASVAGETKMAAVAAAIALAGVFLSGLYMARLYTKKVGGFTGDALGAAVEIGELIVLLACAAILPSL